jgi:hypothetical protein
VDPNQSAIIWAKFKKGLVGYVGESKDEISGGVRYLEKDHTIPVMFAMCGRGEYTALLTGPWANCFTLNLSWHRYGLTLISLDDPLCI